jgi:hypothetical protein
MNDFDRRLKLLENASSNNTNQPPEPVNDVIQDDNLQF